MQNFLRVLEVCLRSAALRINKDLFIQRIEVCIGSAIVHVISEIYLSAFDNAITLLLATVPCSQLLVKRFVDDMLLLSAF